MNKFEVYKNGKVVSTFTTLKEAMDLLNAIAANDFSYDILEVREVNNGKVVSYHDSNDEYWEGKQWK